jgi:phage minor structural protein
VDELGAELYVDSFGYGSPAGRYVRLYRRYGIMAASHDVVKARFAYGHNISSVSREVLSDEVYTAIRALGKDGLTDTVYSSSALELWGRPPGRYQSGPQHRVGRYSNTSCESLEDLQREATTELARVSQPQVTYTFDLEDVGALRLGDVVQVKDPTFGPAVALQGRITKISKDLNREHNGAQVVVGTAPPSQIQVAFKSIANRTYTRRTG